ncbi:hypothetical protein DFJ73DRAFT_777986 [Zopfochytrium polystomum]|nr:hypothetical protein DFJ73DRAFT_777986 [Zopfochytrium polystomum]
MRSTDAGTTSTPRTVDLAADTIAAATWTVPDIASSEDDNGAGAGGGSSSRKFHSVKGSTYFLPSDSLESDRLLMQHNIVRAAFDGIFHSPQRDLFERGGDNVRVLDMACGSASWTREMAKKFPKTTFVGARFLFLGVPRGGWPGVLKELARVTKPGCYVEIIEIHFGFYDAGPLCVKYHAALKEALEARSIDLDAGPRIASLVRDAGLSIVTEKTASIPIGWNGPFGDMGRANMEAAYLGPKAFTAPALRMSEDEFEAVVKDMFDECGM